MLQLDQDRPGTDLNSLVPLVIKLSQSHPESTGAHLSQAVRQGGLLADLARQQRVLVGQRAALWRFIVAVLGLDLTVPRQAERILMREIDQLRRQYARR